MCKKLPSDASDYVMEAVPLLTNLLQYHDSKVIYRLFVIIWYYLASFAVAPFSSIICSYGARFWNMLLYVLLGLLKHLHRILRN